MALSHINIICWYSWTIQVKRGDFSNSINVILHSLPRVYIHTYMHTIQYIHTYNTYNAYIHRTIYLGETFSSYISVHNDSQELAADVVVKVRYFILIYYHMSSKLSSVKNILMLKMQYSYNISFMDCMCSVSYAIIVY